MIADNPRTGATRGTFRLQNGPSFYVVDAASGPNAYVLLGDPSHGPVVAKVHTPNEPCPRFEYGEPWGLNPDDWRGEFEHQTLRICRAPVHTYDSNPSTNTESEDTT